jgi:uncharacterized membrane protein YdjX (TVP38/TMEM64 family)
MESLLHFKDALMAGLGNADPILLFVATALLPLAGFPGSILWIAAGLRFGVVGGSLFSIAALALNMTLAYGLAQRFLKGPVEKLVARYAKKMPSLENRDETWLILLLRVTPGVPLFVQNYVLGLAGVKFIRYLLLSLAVQSGYAVAFVVFGESLTRSSAWRFVLAACALVAATIGAALLRRWIARRKSNRAQSA